MNTITRQLERTITRVMMLMVLAVLVVSALSAAPTTHAASGKTLYADAVNGNDGNDGSKAKPFKTLKKVLSVVKSGGTVKLAKGTYDKTHSGDTYPLQVPSDVAIDGTQGTVLSASSSAAGETGLTFAGDASVKDLEMDAFGTAILANRPTTTVDNISLNNLNFIGNGVGVDAEGLAKIAIKNSHFELNKIGVFGGQKVQVTITSSTLQNNQTGLEGFIIKLRKSSVKGGSIGILAHIEDINLTAKVDLGTASDRGNNIFQNSSDTSVQFFARQNGQQLFAMGNTWNANTQGTQADGKYSSTIKFIGANTDGFNGLNFKLVPPAQSEFRVSKINLNP